MCFPEKSVYPVKTDSPEKCVFWSKKMSPPKNVSSPDNVPPPLNMAPRKMCISRKMCLPIVKDVSPEKCVFPAAAATERTLDKSADWERTNRRTPRVNKRACARKKCRNLGKDGETPGVRTLRSWRKYVAKLEKQRGSMRRKWEKGTRCRGYKTTTHAALESIIPSSFFDTIGNLLEQISTPSTRAEPPVFSLLRHSKFRIYSWHRQKGTLLEIRSKFFEFSGARTRVNKSRIKKIRVLTWRLLFFCSFCISSYLEIRAGCSKQLDRPASFYPKKKQEK